MERLLNQSWTWKIKHTMIGLSKRVGNLRYVLAKDPKDEGEAVPSLEELKKHVLPEKEAPAEEEESKGDQKQEPLKKIIDTLDEAGLPRKVRQLLSDTYKLLAKYKVKYSRVKEFFIEKDGLDIVIELDSASLKNAELVLDFTLVKGESLVNVLQDPAKFLSPTGSSLNEVQLIYCEQTYTATSMSLVAALLTAIGTLQTVDVRPANALPKPDPNNKVDQLEWALDIVSQMMGRNPSVRYDGPNVAIQQAKDDEEAGNLEKGQAADFAKVVESIERPAWEKLIKENEKVLEERKLIPSQKMIKQAVNQLTRGKYNDKIALQYADDGSILAMLRAPFPLMIRFVRKAGRVEFKELVVRICDATFVASDPVLASELIFANVNLGIAVKETANENISLEQSKPIKNEEQLDRELARKLLVEIEKEREPSEKPTIMEHEPYRTISKTVTDNPEGFIKFVEFNKDKVVPYLEQNPKLMKWIETNAQPVHKKLTTLISEAKPEPPK